MLEYHDECSRLILFMYNIYIYYIYMYMCAYTCANWNVYNARYLRLAVNVIHNLFCVHVVFYVHAEHASVTQSGPNIAKLHSICVNRWLPYTGHCFVYTVYVNTCHIYVCR